MMEGRPLQRRNAGFWWSASGRWRAEFPYHWDADDFVSRRELLRLAVMTSGLSSRPRWNNSSPAPEAARV